MITLTGYHVMTQEFITRKFDYVEDAIDYGKDLCSTFKVTHNHVLVFQSSLDYLKKY